VTSRIKREHAAERHEVRSHAGAWERGCSAARSVCIEIGKFIPAQSCAAEMACGGRRDFAVPHGSTSRLARGSTRGEV
jgi:hypothetical protein